MTDIYKIQKFLYEKFNSEEELREKERKKRIEIMLYELGLEVQDK